MGLGNTQVTVGPSGSRPVPRFAFPAARFAVAAFAPAGLVLAAFFIALSSPPAAARTLLVGPGRPLATPMAAASQVLSGDTVEIAAGDYEGDTAVWKADNLVLRGAARFARLHAPAVIPNGKAIWVIQGKNTTVENIEFYGAAVPDLNGAGIRQEGDNLTVRHCYFHDNEDGILGGGGPASEVVIEYSEFARNGHGDGYSHNIYIGNVGSFTLRFCESHHAKVGHDVKSRARKNFILYNRIFDGDDGTASMEIDLPNGGTSFVIGNVIQQGPMTENSTVLAYGAEGLSNEGKDLYVVNNTFVNDRPNGGTFVNVSGGANALIVDNIFAGPGTPYTNQVEVDPIDNLDTLDPGFIDRKNMDYRLAPGSPAIDKGVDPGAVGDFSLAPISQYVPALASMARPRSGALDLGAYEAGTEFSAIHPAAVPAARRVSARASFHDALGRARDIAGPYIGLLRFH